MTQSPARPPRPDTANAQDAFPLSPSGSITGRTANGAGHFADWPQWQTDNPGGVFSQWLRACVAPDWHRATHHPFADAWGTGSVPFENLAMYLVQDHRFIDRFVALLAGAVSRAPTLADRVPGCQFLALLTGAENTYFERCFAALGIDDDTRHNHPDWPATAAFKSLMHDALHSNSYANMLAVVAVAEGTYLDWASRVCAEIENRPADFWFAEWLDLHTGSYFQSVIDYLNAQLDAIGPTLDDAQRSACLDHFRRATELECQFFDAAWGNSRLLTI